MRHFLYFVTLLGVVFLTAAGVGLRPAAAQAGSSSDLINAVNGVRTGYGNPALEVDYTLMASAQATAEIMANSGSCAHIGNASGRMAAAGYGGGAQVWGTENIACGNGLSVETAVYSYWADATHLMPMTVSSYTHIGAGVAEVDGRVYYVIHAAYTSGSSSSSDSGSSNPPQAPAGTPLPTRPVVKPVLTATPHADGSIVHQVELGQTLWSIAASYGISIDDLLALNSHSANTLVVVGDLITVKAAPTQTATATVTKTSPPPTRTLTRTPTPKTPTPTRTATLTQTSTPARWMEVHAPEWFNQSSVGIGIIALSAVGLAGLAFSAFRKK